MTGVLAVNLMDVAAATAHAARLTKGNSHEACCDRIIFSLGITAIR